MPIPHPFVFLHVTDVPEDDAFLPERYPCLAAPDRMPRSVVLDLSVALSRIP